MQRGAHKEMGFGECMKAISCGLRVRIAGILLGSLAVVLSGAGQTYPLTNWVNDPFAATTNFSVTGANSTSPGYANNGHARSTLYVNCPIGSTLKLAKPGDMISSSGQVMIMGDLNADGNLQFRIGLYYRGTNKSDINWVGYMIGNYTGNVSGAPTGLFVRNNPNPGVYASGYPGNAMRPTCNDVAYVPGWGPGTYDYSLSVTLLPGNSQKVDWKLSAVPPGVYNYTGTYTNGFALTEPPAFDEVGMMGGVALFNSPSTADSICLKNANVTLTEQKVAP